MPRAQQFRDLSFNFVRQETGRGAKIYKSLDIWNSLDFKFSIFIFVLLDALAHTGSHICSMNQARHTASRLLPVAGITTAGVAAGAAGLWAWRGRNAAPENR